MALDVLDPEGKVVAALLALLCFGNLIYAYRPIIFAFYEFLEGNRLSFLLFALLDLLELLFDHELILLSGDIDQLFVNIYIVEPLYE